MGIYGASEWEEESLQYQQLLLVLTKLSVLSMGEDTPDENRSRPEEYHGY